jgi:hypothetical protein
MRGIISFELNGYKRKPLGLMSSSWFNPERKRGRVGELLESLLMTKRVKRFRKILTRPEKEEGKNPNEYTGSNLEL